MPIKTTKALFISGSLCVATAANAQSGIQPGADVASLYGDRVKTISGHSVAEGDIIVGRAQLLGSTSVSSRGIGLSNRLGLWEYGIVPYRIDADLPADLQQRILDAIRHWNERAPISIVPVDEVPDALASSYIEFVAGSGCASWVGKQGGNQPVWVSENCTVGSVVHEIGHTLGLLHEHTRADRDQHVQVQLGNIAAEKTFNFDIVDAGAQLLGDYDFGSIMHYGEYFFSANGEATLVPIDAPANVIIGQREALSAGDIAAIARLYATDLALSFSIQPGAEGSGAEVLISVTNNGPNGAHDLRIFVDSPSVPTAFASDAGWSCEQVESLVQCDLQSLANSAQTELVLSIDSGIDLGGIRIQLDSGSFDTVLANNGDQIVTGSDAEMQQTPEIAAALTTEDAINSLAAAGGGGAVSGGLCMALMVWNRRRRLRGSELM